MGELEKISPKFLKHVEDRITFIYPSYNEIKTLRTRYFIFTATAFFMIFLCTGIFTSFLPFALKDVLGNYYKVNPEMLLMIYAAIGMTAISFPLIKQKSLYVVTDNALIISKVHFYYNENLAIPIKNILRISATNQHRGDVILVYKNQDQEEPSYTIYDIDNPHTFVDKILELKKNGTTR